MKTPWLSSLARISRSMSNWQADHAVRTNRLASSQGSSARIQPGWPAHTKPARTERGPTRVPFLMPHPRTAEAGGASCLPRKMPRRRKAEITREWQDLHAMHDLTVSDSNNASWWQDIRTVYSPTAFCRAFWIHGTHILPKLAVFEYMPAICCHQEAFLPPAAPSGIHHGNLLP